MVKLVEDGHHLRLKVEVCKPGQREVQYVQDFHFPDPNPRHGVCATPLLCGTLAILKPERVYGCVQTVRTGRPGLRVCDDDPVRIYVRELRASCGYVAYQAFHRLCVVEQLPTRAFLARGNIHTALQRRARSGIPTSMSKVRGTQYPAILRIVPRSSGSPSGARQAALALTLRILVMPRAAQMLSPPAVCHAKFAHPSQLSLLGKSRV